MSSLRLLGKSLWILAIASAAPLVACSSDDGDGKGNGNGLGKGGSGGTAGTIMGPIVDPNGSGGSFGSGATAGTTGACSGSELNGCVGELYEGESLPLDIYIMFDQSGSMLNDVGGVTRLAAVQQATRDFLRDPDSDGIGVGIGYFGYLPIGETSCDQSSYATPQVPVTQDHEPVIASLDGREPTGETPTAAAIRGACSYASSWKKGNPGRAIVILLVTDGKPEAPVSCQGGGCCPDIYDAEAAAQACYDAAPNIPTYVLGVGPELDQLNGIAQAGGTKRAYLVGNEDVAANVLKALSTIRGDAEIPCSLEIPKPPEGETIDLTQVNLIAGESGADCLAPIYHVETANDCGADGGWYYDHPDSPKSVELCSASCDLVSRPGSSLRFSVGCATLGPPVH